MTGFFMRIMRILRKALSAGAVLCMINKMDMPVVERLEGS